MIIFKKTYVPINIAHFLNYDLEEPKTNEKITKENLEEIEAFIIVEDGVKPDLDIYNFNMIMVLNAVEFNELKFKEELDEIIASTKVIDLRKEGAVEKDV